MNLASKARVLLKPQQTAEESGLYEAVHDSCPSRELQMIFLAGQKLPECRHCGARVRFRLERAIPHISEDGDFKKST